MPGFLAAAGVVQNVGTLWVRVYEQAWFVGFGIAALAYLALMAAPGAADKRAAA